jgi:FkbM family methyltransferase
MAKWMRPGDLMVDCGANVGAVCIAVLLEAGCGQAVAFEPQTRTADILTEMVKANGVDVKLHREAVSSFTGEAVLKFPLDVTISGWGSIADEPDFFEAKNEYADVSSETVQVITLDSWWKEAGKPDVRVVKVDTQGAEPDVLDGGREMFAATVPYLFIEEHGPTLAEHGHTIATFRDRLKAYGYIYDHANRHNLRCWKKGTA